MFRISVLFQFRSVFSPTVREIAIIMSSIFHVHLCAAFLRAFTGSFCLPHEADDSENKRKAHPDGSWLLLESDVTTFFLWFSSSVFLLIFPIFEGYFIFACLPTLNSYGQIELRKMGHSNTLHSLFSVFRIFLQMKFFAKSISMDLFCSRFLPVFVSDSQSFDVWFLSWYLRRLERELRGNLFEFLWIIFLIEELNSGYLWTKLTLTWRWGWGEDKWKNYRQNLLIHLSVLTDL